MANLARIPDHRRRVYRLASLLAFLPAGNDRQAAERKLCALAAEHSDCALFLDYENRT